MILPETITIDSEENLINKLSKLEININRRADGREQDSLEYWALKNYLPLIIDEFKYPIKIIKNESPDFVIEDNGSTIGIEITEATSEYYQELLTFISKNPEYNLESCKIKYGRKYTKKELYSIPKLNNSPLSGNGWSGYGPEISASNWAYDAYFTKFEKLIKWKHPKDIRILLYDNTPTGILYADKFKDYLQHKFSNESASKSFRCDILSKSGKYIITDIQDISKSKLKGEVIDKL